MIIVSESGQSAFNTDHIVCMGLVIAGETENGDPVYSLTARMTEGPNLSLIKGSKKECLSYMNMISFKSMGRYQR